MNLERNFRHSVEHTRWQVKFMVLGIRGMLRGPIYTDSQVILFWVVNAGLEIVNIGVLILANLLIARSFWRAKFSSSIFISPILSSTILSRSYW